MPPALSRRLGKPQQQLCRARRQPIAVLAEGAHLGSGRTATIGAPMPLSPPPYLLKVRDFLRETERGRWAWFASDEWTAEYVETVRLELLKSTYRMEPASHGALYAIGGRAAEALELDVPVTFYQAHDDGAMNAGLLFVPGEAHIVLRGRVLATLSEHELSALVAHELAHYRLETLEDGSIRIAQEILESIASHPGASASHVTMTLRARRYAEIYADRGSHLVAADPAHVVGCLVKVDTGLTDVDPGAYLRQAEEIFSKKGVTSGALSHPENFIRARAISLWHEQGARAESAIAAMVQGERSMDALDLLDQRALTETTREIIDALLAPAWFRSDGVLAHAKAFFPDIAAVPSATSVVDAAELDKSLQDYFAYVLLDFAVVDEALGEAGLAHALRHAEAMGIAEPFDRVARDELKMTKRALDDLRKKAPTILERAAAQHEGGA